MLSIESLNLTRAQMPLRLTVNALRLQGTGINPVSVLIPFKVLILEVSPAFPLGAGTRPEKPPVPLAPRGRLANF